MRLKNLKINNFRNFESVDIPLSSNIVLLGENRVGKSNLLFGNVNRVGNGSVFLCNNM